MDLYRGGECRETFELHELRSLHETNSDVVEAFLAEAEQFRRVERESCLRRTPEARGTSRLKTNPELEAPPVPTTRCRAIPTCLRARVGISRDTERRG